MKTIGQPVASHSQPQYSFSILFAASIVWRFELHLGASRTGWTFRWHGMTTGFPDNGAAEANLTGSMHNFMIEHGITQAQLSVASNGEQLANYAFNWNEPSNTDVQVDDHFLLASISKIYCVASARVLMRAHQLQPDTKVYEKLGYTHKDATDPRVFDITVAHLLDHLGGDNSASYGRDPAYSMRDIALNMSSGAHPTTEREIIEWKLKQPLDFTPGNTTYCSTTNHRDFCYSNYGFILLGYLITNITRSSDYFSWLNSHILQPYALDVTRWLTDEKYHTSDVVKQLDSGYGPSALDPRKPENEFVQGIYGGDGMFKDSDMAGAALAASAATITKTLAAFPVWGWQPARFPGAARTGSTPGAFAYATQRWDGLDVAMTFNTRNFDTDLVMDVLYPELDQYLNDHR
ncbi:hypothetical protein ACN47E_004903 [Coniothyrium glycines]